MLKKYKSIVIDFGLNFIASFMLTVVTQFVLFPYVARTHNSDVYGIILSLMGIANTIVGTVGGSLNNTRLIVESEYNDGESKGDFNVILLFLLFVSILFFYLIAQREKNNLSISSFSLYIFFATLRTYSSVYFRIKIDYKKNLIANVFVVLGSFVGLLISSIYPFNNSWMIAFFLGEFCGLIYIILQSDFLREKFIITSNFKNIATKEFFLLLTTLFANILMYLDRFILLPILGGTSVAIYTVASFLGKSIGIFMTPLSGVLLTYYSKKGFIFNRKIFFKINISLLIFSIPFFIICYFFAPIVTKIFYPDFIENVKPYYVLVHITMILNSIGNMMQPAILKFVKIYWQFIVQLFYVVCFIGIGTWLSYSYGIMGFTIAALVSSVVRVVILNIVGGCFIQNE